VLFRSKKYTYGSAKEVFKNAIIDHPKPVVTPKMG